MPGIATQSRRAGGRSVVVAAGLAAGMAAALHGGGAPARAEAIYQLVPSVGAGFTTNANEASVPRLREPDEFGVAGVSAGATYDRALSTHSLALTFAYTEYLHHHGPDTVTGALAWTSSFRPTALVDLHLTVNAGVSRLGRVDVTDLTTVMPQPSLQGSDYLFSTGASQSLNYRPTGRRLYSESLTALQVRYFDSPDPLPTTTFIGTDLRGSVLRANDVYFLDVQLSDTYTAVDPTILQGQFAEGHTFLGQIMAGWQRTFSPFWSGQLMGGPVAIFKLADAAVIGPGGSLTLNYARLPWFVTLALSQVPVPNLYIGEATINDQAMARVALPLNRSELYYVVGFASYVYARVATNQGSLSRAFDQRTAGVSLTARLQRLPVGASLQYTFVDQEHGDVIDGRVIPDLQSQVVLFSLSGVFSWGPGTPPLFAGRP